LTKKITLDLIMFNSSLNKTQAINLLVDIPIDDFSVNSYRSLLK